MLDKSSIRVKTAGPRAPGRRRDPEVEPKVLAAALRLYAADGWSGFSIDAVARESGVGKSAIYRRWTSSEDLLIHAFERLKFPTGRDCGSLRADMLDYALQWAEWFSDPVTSGAGARILPDCDGNPDLEAMYRKVIERPKQRYAMAIGRRAFARGELNPSVAPMTIVEMIVGAMQMHTTWSKARGPRLRAGLIAYAPTLVDAVLGGVGTVDEAVA